MAQLVSALTEYGVIYTLALQSVTPLLAHLLAAMGTLFIEIGLRKFLPFSFRALLNKRFKGLHLTLSILVLAVAGLLLFTSALLSFHGSKHIVTHFTSDPVPIDSTLWLQRDKAIQSALQRWQMDSSIISQRYLPRQQELLANYTAQVARLSSRSPSQLAILRSQRATKLADIEQQRTLAMEKALMYRDSALEAIEARYETIHAAAMQAQQTTRQKAEEKALRHGTNLGWFTVVALLVLIACIGIEETYHKGSGIKEVASATPYTFSPGVWAMFVEASNLSWQSAARAWIARSFPRPAVEQSGSDTIAVATQNCDHCGKTYTRMRKDQRFCGKSCRLAYHAIKHNGKVFLPATYQKARALNGR